ncbi:MAG: hypothetical protein ACFE8A_08590 [Candidatus Hodarchaeota archaeon]
MCLERRKYKKKKKLLALAILTVMNSYHSDALNVGVLSIIWTRHKNS